MVHILNLVAALHLQIAQEAAIERARAFYTVAAKGYYGEVMGSYWPLQLDSVTQEHAMYRLKFRLSTTTVDQSTGAIVGFNDSFEGLESDSWSANALRREQALEHAQRLWLAAGHGEPFKLYWAEKWSSGSHMQWKFDVLRTFQGIPFHYRHGGVISMEHVSGRLSMMGLFPNSPQPPTSLVPTVSLSTARARLIGALFSFRPAIETVYEMHPVRLMIWRPDPRQLTVDHLSAEHRTLGEANKGVLVYFTYLHNATRYGKNGEPIGAYSVFLDAKTGHLIGIEALEGGVGGAASATKTSLGWDLANGSAVELIVGSKVFTVTGGHIQPVRVRRPPLQTRKLLLRTDRMVRSIRFDVDSGLIWTGAGENLQCGKPNAKLLSVLRRAK